MFTYFCWLKYHEFFCSFEIYQAFQIVNSSLSMEPILFMIYSNLPNNVFLISSESKKFFLYKFLLKFIYLIFVIEIISHFFRLCSEITGGFLKTEIVARALVTIILNLQFLVQIASIIQMSPYS